MKKIKILQAFVALIFLVLTSNSMATSIEYGKIYNEATELMKKDQLQEALMKLEEIIKDKNAPKHVDLYVQKVMKKVQYDMATAWLDSNSNNRKSPFPLTIEIALKYLTDNPYAIDLFNDKPDYMKAISRNKDQKITAEQALEREKENLLISQKRQQTISILVEDNIESKQWKDRADRTSDELNKLRGQIDRALPSTPAVSGKEIAPPGGLVIDRKHEELYEKYETMSVVNFMYEMLKLALAGQDRTKRLVTEYDFNILLESSNKVSPKDRVAFMEQVAFIMGQNKEFNILDWRSAFSSLSEISAEDRVLLIKKISSLIPSSIDDSSRLKMIGMLFGVPKDHRDLYIRQVRSFDKVCKNGEDYVKVIRALPYVPPEKRNVFALFCVANPGKIKPSEIYEVYALDPSLWQLKLVELRDIPPEQIVPVEALYKTMKVPEKDEKDKKSAPAPTHAASGASAAAAPAPTPPPSASGASAPGDETAASNSATGAAASVKK